ncbi:Multiple inositol polyphosphate phosphatase 1 [Penaeus vannamei]|uniref:Multiple inositol polyphosphate phosphatase 1 n=1 Tax=Penaeus vannamei TaxID=6689 RepID=A0A423TYU2_PENVA|nr:Multiple inositol polyphosphate phosphatase 1 [Penaeus vannamei]
MNKPPGSLCKKDIELLKEWDAEKLPHDRRMQLLETGRVEMKKLGARVREALPQFFNESILNHNISVWSTKTDRTKETAKVFLEGFSPLQNLEKTIVVKERDRIMQFHEICHKYNEKVFHGSHIPAFMKFLKGPKIQSVVDSVSKRIAVTVESLHVVLMYNACRYYKVMEPLKHSAWCAVFSRKDMEVMEFGEDLFLHHDHGYAFDITYEQACPVVQDILQRFRYQNDSSVFYFTHLEAVIKVITRFGFFNDSKPLTWDTMDSRRRWRTSDFGGFGSNIAFLLTKCKEVGWTVNTYINEKRAHLPKCARTKGCPWLLFKKLYGKYEVCPFDELSPLPLSPPSLFLYFPSSPPPYSSPSSTISLPPLFLLPLLPPPYPPLPPILTCSPPSPIIPFSLSSPSPLLFSLRSPLLPFLPSLSLSLLPSCLLSLFLFLFFFFPPFSLPAFSLSLLPFLLLSLPLLPFLLLPPPSPPLPPPSPIPLPPSTHS